MDTEILIYFAATAFAYLLWAYTKKTPEPFPMPDDPEGMAIMEWFKLPEKQKTVAAVEKHLAQHPDNLSRRWGILEELAHGDARDFGRLRHHTLELIRRLPGTVEIVCSNYSEFFRNAEYRREVIAALESQLGKDLEDGKIHGNLAEIHTIAALPIPKSEQEDFKNCHQLEPNTVLPTELNDQELVAAIRHFMQAVALMPEGEVRKARQLEKLANVLYQAGRFEEAIATFEQAEGMVDLEDRASLFLDYGECLIKTDRVGEGVSKLCQVRDCDMEGFEAGPGCNTMTAETLMGHIALKEGDWAKAAEHLAASTDVQRCCHNTTRGFPIHLARELMSHDRPAIASFCRKVLAKFTPNDPDIQTLLDEAES